MTILATVLSVVLLCGICAAQFATRLQPETKEHELEDLASIGRALEQMESGSEFPQEEETKAVDCTEVILGANLSLTRDEALRILTTASITECCEGCQSAKGCTTFSRNRSSGSCELFSAEDPYFSFNPVSDYDIGGMLGDGFFPASFIAASATQVPNCIVSQGRAYPNGNLLARGNSPSAEHCCNVCRQSNDCYSWYYNTANDRCTLNRNIPFAEERNSSRFRGGTVLN